MGEPWTWQHEHREWDENDLLDLVKADAEDSLHLHDKASAALGRTNEEE